MANPIPVYSYIELEDADTYFSTRPDSDVWTNSTTTDKQNALYKSTRAIDRLQFQGVKTNNYNHDVNGASLVAQPLEFPRNGDTVVPDAIRIACCECAIAFLDGVDINMEMESLNVISEGFASVRRSYSDNQETVGLYIRAGIPSAEAWMYLLPYLSDVRQISLARL